MGGRICVLICFCLAFSSGMAQRSEFLRLAKMDLSVEDKLSAIEASNVGAQQFDPLAFSKEDFQHTVLAYLKRCSKNKRFTLQESFHLKRICEITLKTIRNSYFKDRSKFRKILKRAQHASLSKFGLIEVYSFEIPLIQARSGQFYYDRKGVEGTLNLYYNQQKMSKKAKEMQEDPPEPKPVLLYTEAEIMQAIENKIKRNSIYSELQSGNYYAAGISMEVNEKTLFRKKVPMLRVVVALGSKRMHLVQKKVERMEKRRK